MSPDLQVHWTARLAQRVPPCACALGWGRAATVPCRRMACSGASGPCAPCKWCVRGSTKHPVPAWAGEREALAAFFSLAAACTRAVHTGRLAGSASDRAKVQVQRQISILVLSVTYMHFQTGKMPTARQRGSGAACGPGQCRSTAPQRRNAVLCEKRLALAGCLAQRKMPCNVQAFCLLPSPPQAVILGKKCLRRLCTLRQQLIFA